MQGKKITTALLTVLTLLWNVSIAQLDIPQPSPFGKVFQKVGLNEITIEYSRPGAKDRVIFGDLVPYGKLWRTGANAATKITLKDAAKFEGKDIPAGEYYLITIPGSAEWTIIISKENKTGLPDYKQENDLVRFVVKPGKVADKVETFTINISNVQTESANIDLVWENTKVSFKMETEVDKKVMEQIEKATQGIDPMIYYRSAVYYYDTNRDLAKALDWINTALASKETFFMLHSKAKIQAKMGDKKGAIATAEKSKAVALKEGNEGFIDLNNKAIAEWSKK